MTHVDDEYPDAAPLDFQRAQVRAYLARLAGVALTPIDASDDAGACFDCKQTRQRYSFGAQLVCLRCALLRRGAGLKVAA